MRLPLVWEGSGSIPGRGTLICRAQSLGGTQGYGPGRHCHYPWGYCQERGRGNGQAIILTVSDAIVRS